MIGVRNLGCSYRIGDHRVAVIRDLSFSISRGEMVAFHGPSGSGKSTLFYVLGCMLRPDAGSVLMDGEDITKLSQEKMAFVRNRPDRLRLPAVP